MHFKTAVPATVQFLASPAEIRRAIVRGFAAANAVDLAVAFVGEDWWSLLGSLSVPVRVVCWLSSTNTNPYAVEQMLARPGFEVRQLDRMHAKVYLAHGDPSSVVIGSANISGAALAADDGVGQHEAAVSSTNSRLVADSQSWFEALWESATAISASDLEAARAAWDNTHSGFRGAASASGNKSQPSALPRDWIPDPLLEQLTVTVADYDLINGGEFGDEWAFLESLDPAALTAQDVDEIFRFLVKWAGHPGVFRPFTQHPLKYLQRAFSLLFDESVDIETRLRSVAPGGNQKVPGIGLTSWTIMLQWRLPSLYPPFNRRTIRFLRDFELAAYAPRALSPVGYSQWCAFARELSGRLHLPTPGHVDRMVWEYTKDKEIL